MNTVIDKSAGGIGIYDYNSPDTVIYPQIIVENCVIRNICSASNDRIFEYGFLLYGGIGIDTPMFQWQLVINNQLSHFTWIDGSIPVTPTRRKDLSTS